MIEMDYPELVEMVRKRLNDQRGNWREIAYKLGRSEGVDPDSAYRWLREFSDGTFAKVDGGKLQRVAHAVGCHIIYSIDPMKNGTARPRQRRG